MPHQKSTVLSVCFIYQRSAYLEAIVIEHYRLYTYFSGIVPSIRIRKWVNWYADCLSLKPFQNQLCHWFSAGTCISFLNAMCCSARVQWGQTHVKPVLFFIQLELPLTSREILPQVRSQAWKLKTAAFATLSVWATHGNISDSVPSSPPLFTGLCFACFRVRTRDFKKVFHIASEELSAPWAAAVFPPGGTSSTAIGTWCLASLRMSLKPCNHPYALKAHAHPWQNALICVFCFLFSTEFHFWATNRASNNDE